MSALFSGSGFLNFWSGHPPIPRHTTFFGQGWRFYATYDHVLEEH
jgi:hypothetical protein